MDADTDGTRLQPHVVDTSVGLAAAASPCVDPQRLGCLRGGLQTHRHRTNSRCPST